MSALDEFITLDLMPLTASALAAVACALIGNFLVLRREAMLGDAISHAVLPGLVIAFVFVGAAGPLPMLIGAAACGLLCAVLIDLLQKSTRLEPGASIGVVFTVMFALGVLLIELLARNSHIDTDCLLFGNVEYLSPWTPTDPLPRQLHLLSAALVLNIVGITVLFKELRLVSFDPQFASAIGIRSGALHLLIMAMVAFTVVASFEAVGSILVVAMLICPAACARLLTDRLRTQLLISCTVGLVVAIAGYAAATRGLPLLLGDERGTVQVAGMMATLAGAAVALTVCLAPRRGLLAKLIHTTALRRRIMAEDVLGMLYRLEEAGGIPGGEQTLRAAQITQALCTQPGDRRRLRRALQTLNRADELRLVPDRILPETQCSLTDRGRIRAKSLIRSHRLWESYLVHVLGLRPDHVHQSAERLEHLTTKQLADALSRKVEQTTGSIDVDPHKRPIPGPERP